MAKVNFPKANPEGIKDLSKGQNPPISEAPLPSNLPLIFLLTEKGEEEPVLVETSKLLAEFGANSFSETSAYYTHQTRLANIHIGNGNAIMVQRIRPANATTARLRISLEVIPNQLQWDGTDFVGHRLIWHVGIDPYVAGFRDYGKGNAITGYRSGTLLSTTGEKLGVYDGPTGPIHPTSTLYPILDIDVRTFGTHGNNTAISIEPIVEGLGSPEAHLSTKAFMYRFRFGTRLRSTDVPVTRATGLGNDYFDANFLMESSLPRLNRSAFLADVIEHEWEGSDYFQANPFTAPYVYTDNLKAVLEKLQVGYVLAGTQVLGESAFDVDLPDTVDSRFALGSDLENAFLLNIVNGLMFDGVTEYRSFKVDRSGLFGGVNIGAGFQYAKGGNDGLSYFADGRPNRLANMQILDDAVRVYMDEFGSGKFKLLDMAVYPMSTVWDTGFSYNTKISLLTAAQRRRDIAVFLTPFIYADYVTVDDGTPAPTPTPTPLGPGGGGAPDLGDVNPTNP